LLINKNYEPFWTKYLSEFNRNKYTSSGKQGWDHPADSLKRRTAREPINRLKNLECIRLFRLDFVNKVTSIVHDKVSLKITGISRRLMKRGIRKHIRLMLTDFIFNTK